MPYDETLPDGFVHARRDLEARLTRTLSTLARHEWKSFRDWIIAAIRDPETAAMLVHAADLPPALDADGLMRLFSSESAFSQVSLRLAARRLYFFLRPFTELANSPYCPPDWKFLRAPIERLLAACDEHVLRDPLRWSDLWTLVSARIDGADATKELLSTAPLRRHTEMSVDPKEFVILETTSAWRYQRIRDHLDAKDDALEWEPTRWQLASNQLGLFFDKRLKDTQSPKNGEETLELENAWWALETLVWLDSASDAHPNGTCEISGKRLEHLEWLLERTEYSVSRAPQSLGVLHFGEEYRDRLRFALTPDVFGISRSVLFAGQNAMLLWRRLYVSERKENKTALTDRLTRLIEACIAHCITLRDNGHLWWMCQRLRFLYNWIDWYRSATVFTALLRSDSLSSRENTAAATSLSSEGLVTTFGKAAFGPFQYRIVRQQAEMLANLLASRKLGAESKSREAATFLLAPPGTGKSMFIAALGDALQAKGHSIVHTEKIHARKLQHVQDRLAMASFLQEATKDTTTSNTPLILLDEFHLSTTFDQYAELLTPLEDNVVLSPEGYPLGDRFAVYMFATSRFVDEADFMRTARNSSNQSMTDFGTRISRWLVVPELPLLPIQRMAIFLGHRQRKRRTARFVELLWIATETDSRFETGRGVQKAAVLPSDESLEFAERRTTALFGIDRHFDSRSFSV